MEAKKIGNAENYIESKYILPNNDLKEKLGQCLFPNTDDLTDEKVWLNNFIESKELHSDLTISTLNFFDQG